MVIPGQTKVEPDKKVLKIYFQLSILITVSLALLVLVQYFTIQPEIPLFYSLARDTQHLVAKEWLFLFPVISALISGVHLGLLRRLHAQVEAILVTLFGWSTIVIQLLLAISLIRIIWIVT